MAQALFRTIDLKTGGLENWFKNDCRFKNGEVLRGREAKILFDNSINYGQTGPRLTDKMRAARLKGHSSSLTEEGSDNRTRNRRTRGLFSQVETIFICDIELERYQAFLLYNVQIRLEGSRKAGSREPK